MARKIRSELLMRTGNIGVGTRADLRQLFLQKSQFALQPLTGRTECPSMLFLALQSRLPLGVEIPRPALVARETLHRQIARQPQNRRDTAVFLGVTPALTDKLSLLVNLFAQLL